MRARAVLAGVGRVRSTSSAAGRQRITCLRTLEEPSFDVYRELTVRSFRATYNSLVDQRQERQARNEALVRQVNEKIEQVDQASSFADDEMAFEFHCECGRADDDEIGCDERVVMTLREYEDIRAQDDRFAVVPGHEDAALEDVVRRSDRFLVVDKKPVAEPLVADDPRGAASG